MQPTTPNVGGGTAAKTIALGCGIGCLAMIGLLIVLTIIVALISSSTATRERHGRAGFSGRATSVAARHAIVLRLIL
jgi:hypothetical protein